MKLFIIAILLALVLSMPAAAASDVPDCEPKAQAEGQKLYLCDLGIICVWDPSPALGAGVMDCDW